MTNETFKSSHLIVFIYNSFLDPLFQNILLDYIKTLAQSKKVTFHVITFEQPQYEIKADEQARLTKSLDKLKIKWYPMKFHTGRFLLLKKAFDFLQVFLLIAKLKLQLKAKAILAFANVSAAYSYIFSRVFKMKLVVYSYEPHSEFLAELGLWKTSSLKYKILHTLETLAGLKGDYIMTGTRHMVKHLENQKAKGKIFRAPTGIDKDKFYPLDSSTLRKKLGLTDRKVLFYIGKFGDLYYSHEIPRLFQIIKKEVPDLFFLVITPSDISNVKSYFDQYQIDSKDYLLLASKFTQQEINEHMNTADICLSAVPPSPSQKFRSPTKVGEYLMCGKPFITCEGVSEDDEFAKEYQVGVVLEDFSEGVMNNSIPTLKALLDEKTSVLQEKCRKTGITYRDKNNVISIMDKIIDEIYYSNISIES